MTDRDSLDWPSMGFGGDPVAGSPEAVTEKVTQFKSTAEAIGTAAAKLRLLRSRDDTVSEAVAKIVAKADETAKILDSAQKRYAGLANGLSGYPEELRQAQATSLEGVNEGTAARKRIDQALQTRREAEKKTRRVEESERAQANQELGAAQASVNQAVQDLENAKAKIRGAIAKRDTAARAASSQVDMTLQDSSLNDSWWEKVWDFVSGVGQWVWEHIDEICLILDALALILALTGVGGPVAAVLKLVTTLARAAKVVAAVKTGVDILYGLYVGCTTGEWGKFGSALGGFLLSKLGGKAVGGLSTRFGGKMANLAAKKSPPALLRIVTRSSSSVLTASSARIGNVTVTLISSRTTTTVTSLTRLIPSSAMKMSNEIGRDLVKGVGEYIGNKAGGKVGEMTGNLFGSESSLETYRSTGAKK